MTPCRFFCIIDDRSSPIGSYNDGEADRRHEDRAGHGGTLRVRDLGGKYPKVQLFAVAELPAGKTVEMLSIHQVGGTFKKALKVTKQQGEQQELQV